MSEPVNDEIEVRKDFDLKHKLSYILTGDDYFTSSECKDEIDRIVDLITSQTKKAEFVGAIKALEKLPIIEIVNSKGFRTDGVLAKEVYAAININKTISAIKQEREKL